MATVRHFLDLHTGYVTPLTRSLLAENSIGSVVVNEMEHGFLVFVGTASKGDLLEAEVPADLIEVMLHARKHGCDYIMFDSDGPADDELAYHGEHNYSVSFTSSLIPEAGASADERMNSARAFLQNNRSDLAWEVGSIVEIVDEAALTMVVDLSQVTFGPSERDSRRAMVTVVVCADSAEDAAAFAEQMLKAPAEVAS